MNVRTQHDRPPKRSGGVAHRGPTLALGLALAVALLAALLVPLAGTAQEAPAEVPVATEEAPVETPIVSEPPVVEEPPLAEETPAIEETPDAALEGQEDSLTSAIFVAMRECPSLYDGDIQQLNANCLPADDIAFDVYGGGVLQQSAQGYFESAELPSGQYTIRYDRPASYAYPLALCGIGPTGTSPNLAEVVIIDGHYEFGLDAGEAIACYWFHVPESEATVRVANLFCPADVDVSSPDFAALSLVCRDVKSFGFEILDGNLDSLGSGSTDPATGVIVFEHLPAGRTIVSQGFIDGYTAEPAVFCDRYSGDGQRTGFQLQTVYSDDPSRGGGNSHVIDSTLNDLDILDCAWFSFPNEDGAEVLIQKWFCPEDDTVVYSAQDLDFFMATPNPCELYEGDGVRFDLYSHADDTTESRYTGVTGIAAAVWEKVSAGKVTVAEDGWENYGTPVVFCGAAAGSSYNAFPVAVAGHAADFEILGYGCLSHEGDEVSFGLFSHLTGERQTAAFGSGPLGSARWAEAAAGLTEIKGYAPAGYGTPAVFCRAGSPNQTSLPVELIGENAGFSMPPGRDVTCSWYHLPAADDDAMNANVSVEIVAGESRKGPITS